MDKHDKNLKQPPNETGSQSTTRQNPPQPQGDGRMANGQPAPDEAALRETEQRRIDEERAAAGNPTKAPGPGDEEIEVRDGATYDRNGDEIRR